MGTGYYKVEGVSHFVGVYVKDQTREWGRQRILPQKHMLLLFCFYVL